MSDTDGTFDDFCPVPKYGDSPIQLDKMYIIAIACVLSLACVSSVCAVVMCIRYKKSRGMNLNLGDNLKV